MTTATPIKNCENPGCNKPFKAYRHNKANRFCSKQCYADFRRGGYAPAPGADVVLCRLPRCKKVCADEIAHHGMCSRHFEQYSWLVQS